MRIIAQQILRAKSKSNIKRDEFSTRTSWALSSADVLVLAKGSFRLCDKSWKLSPYSLDQRLLPPLI